MSFKVKMQENPAAAFDFLPQQDGFLGLEEAQASDPAAAAAWILPFGLERTVSYGSGAERGPQAIIDASHQVELFDEWWWSEPVHDYGIATIAPADLSVYQDMPAALEALEAQVGAMMDAGKFPLVLGGEHGISPGAVKAVADRHPEGLTILHFDAHADLRDGYDGEHYSHAAALRRCLDFPQVRLVSVGIRNISDGEIPFCAEEWRNDRVKIFWSCMRRAGWTAEDVAKAVGAGPVYISFDVDAFDAALMPATGTPEPGGLDWDDVMQVLLAVRKNNPQFVGADVVELAPVDGLHGCDFTVAKLCYRILNLCCGPMPEPPEWTGIRL